MRSPSFQQFINNDGSSEQPQYSNQQQEYNLPTETKDGVSVVPKSNPFNEKKYNSVAFPDTPIENQSGMVESLLNDKEVPEEVKRKFWFIFHKDNTLTFLDEGRKQSKLLNFDIAKIDMLNTMAYYDYDFEEELGFTVLRNVFETKLDRALGFKGTGQKNERIVLQSQFSENRQINDNDGSHIKEGFFKRLLGRR